MIQTVKTLQEFSRLVKPNDIVWIVAADVEDGKTWCSDCDRTKFMIEEQVKDLDVIQIQIEKVDMRNKENEFRKHPIIQLTCVPTLMRWGSSARLGDVECQDINNIKAFLHGK